ncbi:MAG: metallophosphoesterase family protein [Chloroflexota bacterium]|nr:metallophosphoesterase family protein [Chloroflexota bacterium]
MKILVISDIHANLTALEAVLKDAGDVDAVWCLGDIVGYGPDPNECVEIVRNLPNLVCLQGNHDQATVNIIDTSSFNPEAQASVHWTQKTLTETAKTYLEELPSRIQLEGVTLVHGSPRKPVWEYIIDPYTATKNFEYFETDYCFVGHTHIPLIFTLIENDNIARVNACTPNKQLVLPKRTIINPGSVGQPRDEDPRSAYAIFDSENNTWDNHRVAYKIKDVQERMRKAGLPKMHVRRLELGW